MRLKDFFDRYSAYLYNIILFECTILLIKLNSCLPKFLFTYKNSVKTPHTKEDSKDNS